MTDRENIIGSTIPAVKAIRQGEETEPGVYRIPMSDGSVIAELTVAQIVDVEPDNSGISEREAADD